MNKANYILLETEIIKTALDIARRKRPAYTSNDDDVLFNFKDAAREAGVSPKTAWLILAHKHWKALTSFAKNSNIPQAESVIGRGADLINYVILLMGLAIDDGDIDYEFEFKASPYSKEGRE